MGEVKQYAQRDLMGMDSAGNHYCRHVSAITREELHSKSDIAAELGWRDMQIAALKAEREALAAENLALKEFGDTLNDMHNNLNGEGTGIQGRAEVACQQVALEAALEEFDAIQTPATEAYANQLRAEGIPEQLREIGELIRTQDNRITDQPMFVVYEKREIIGSDEHSPSRIAWVCESEEVDELRGKRLELLYQNGRDTSGYDRYAMQEIDVFVIACFTENGCKEYLRKNGHNLRHPYIYAAGSYRNDEYQAVRNWLESLPLIASMDGD